MDPLDSSSDADSASDYTEADSDRLFSFLEQIEDSILVSQVSYLYCFYLTFWRLF